MTLTPLAQRLARADAEPDVDWNIMAENAPQWPDPPAVPDLTWSDGDDVYGPSQGIAPLLDVLVARARGQGAALGTGSVLVTNGGFDALALLARRLRAGGARRIVCAEPVLVSVAGLFAQLGLQPVVRDWEWLANGDTARMPLGGDDVVYVNTPHNPTGACLSGPAIEELLRDQRRRGFQVIFDLVYDDFQFGEPAVSPLAHVQDWNGVHAVNSFSKNYGAPGLRVGWLLAEPEMITDLTAAFELERIAVSGAAQRRAVALWENGNAPLVAAVEHGRKHVLDLAAEHGIEVTPGAGGTQVWLDPQAGDTEVFADRLMAEERLVITTGTNYYPRYPRHIRFPVGMPIDRLDAGMRALARVRSRLGRTERRAWPPR